MEILVIDAQGGGLGKEIVTSLKKGIPEIEIAAIGTNSTAAAAMKKAGAKMAATGENAIIVSAPKAKVIIGPIGIVLADSMMGEITGEIAKAVSDSNAYKILIPMNRCGTYVTGVVNSTISELINEAVEQTKKFLQIDKHSDIKCIENNKSFI